MPQAADQPLDDLVNGPAPVTIADVITRMQAIDALLPVNDGIKWFNQLYLMVTQQVDLHPPGGAWESPVWLNRLDVVFAGLYFSGLAGFLAGHSVPSAWNALFEARYRTGIDRIQFALAGMNAHINHDLALALLATDAELNVVPAPGQSRIRRLPIRERAAQHGDALGTDNARSRYVGRNRTRHRQNRSTARFLGYLPRPRSCLGLRQPSAKPRRAPPRLRSQLTGHADGCPRPSHSRHRLNTRGERRIHPRVCPIVRQSENRDRRIQMHFSVLKDGLRDPIWTNPTPFVSMD